MTDNAVKPVIVGIDGSAQAEDAALWAVDEAVGRGVPLRLIYVVRTDLIGSLTASKYRSTLDDAKLALHNACSEVAATGRDVDVTADIAHGSPAGVLLAESRDASMICLGASGMGWVGQAIVGSTAATVAAQAASTVAIVRNGDDGAAQTETHWVMVPVSAFAKTRPDVVEAAIHEARLRGRPLLVIGVRHPNLGVTHSDIVERIVADWQRQFPDVRMYAVAEGTSLDRFLADHPELAGTVIADAEHAGDVASLLGSKHAASRAERTVVIARDNADWRASPAAAARC